MFAALQCMHFYVETRGQQHVCNPSMHDWIDGMFAANAAAMTTVAAMTTAAAAATALAAAMTDGRLGI